MGAYSELTLRTRTIGLDHAHGELVELVVGLQRDVRRQKRLKGILY